MLSEGDIKFDKEDKNVEKFVKKEVIVYDLIDKEVVKDFK